MDSKLGRRALWPWEFILAWVDSIRFGEWGTVIAMPAIIVGAAVVTGWNVEVDSWLTSAVIVVILWAVGFMVDLERDYEERFETYGELIFYLVQLLLEIGLGIMIGIWF